ncbi:MATE family efflux transporter [Secundilactobacillus paracollinoides]|uniref:MATE family efflux transporter n=1 Tax=Secundilactobacillus paracollinoides TaxID=240427 RepID=UPI00081A37C0|nr:MATE family efflux transporter [Secundilactobacillus paracollinoides]ANZ65014.1 MATE family efflux transporter [Secundilactobacillus paracollinoides]
MRKNDLGRAPVLPLVLRLAIPTMLAQFVNVLYSIVDRMFIGHIPEIGNDALAGVGVCGPIIAVLYAFCYLIGQGGTPLMAMALGANEQRQAAAVMANCFRLLIGLGIGLTVIFLLIRKQLLWWFGASSATYPYADRFLTIYLCGTLFALLSGGMNSFLIAQGRSGLGVGTVLTGTLLNILLDPILIFKLQLGVEGAALATVISQAVSTVFALSCLRHMKLTVQLRWGRFDPTLCKKIMMLGLAPFLTYALDSGLLIVLNATLQRTGGPDEGDLLISCATIIQSYMLLITSPLSGITMGSQGIVSFNLGAKHYQRVKSALWSVYFVCLGFCSVMFLVSFFATPYFVHLFTADATLVRHAVPYIRLYAAGVSCMAAQWTVTDMGIAMEQMRMALICSLIRKGLYLVGVLVLPILFYPAAAFAAQPICDVVASVISIGAFFRVIPPLLQQKRVGV